jgi:hypothetical protein
LRFSKKRKKSPKKMQVLGDVTFERRDHSVGVVLVVLCDGATTLGFHGLPDELLTIILTSECVPVTKRRQMHKRFARVYGPLIRCRHPQCKEMMPAFVLTFAALFGIVTKDTVVTARARESTGARCTRYSSQIAARRSAWRAQNTVFNGEKKILLSGKPHAILTFMCETLEAFAEPTDEEYWEEFQVSHGAKDDMAVDRLEHVRRKRFEKLQYLMSSLQESYPIAVNRIITEEATKIKCDRFMARIFGRIICHYFIEHRKWNPGFLHLRQVALAVGPITDVSDVSIRAVIPAIATHLTSRRHFRQRLDAQTLEVAGNASAESRG